MKRTYLQYLCIFSRDGCSVSRLLAVTLILCTHLKTPEVQISSFINVVSDIAQQAAQGHNTLALTFSKV